MTTARFTIFVMLLGVKVGNSCRQSCAMRCNPKSPSPAPGLHHDYGQIHNLCNALRCQFLQTELCYALQSQRLRRRPGAGAGDLRGRRRRRRDYIMAMAKFTIYSCRQSCAMRCTPAGDLRGRRRQRRRRDHIMTMARLSIYLMLLGVKVVNSCRQSCAMRCNPSAGAGAGITS